MYYIEKIKKYWGFSDIKYLKKYNLLRLKINL